MNDLSGFRHYFDDSIPPRQYTDGDVLNFYVNNRSLKVSEIASITGRSLPEFYRIIRSFNVEPNRHKNQQGMVQELQRQGYGVKRIAELTGYTPRNVRYIISKNRMND